MRCLVRPLAPVFLFCTLTGCYTQLRAPEPSHFAALAVPAAQDGTTSILPRLSESPALSGVQEAPRPASPRLHVSLNYGLFPGGIYDPWNRPFGNSIGGAWTSRMSLLTSCGLIQTPRWHVGVSHLFYNPYGDRWSNRMTLLVSYGTPRWQIGIEIVLYDSGKSRRPLKTISPDPRVGNLTFLPTSSAPVHTVAPRPRIRRGGFGPKAVSAASVRGRNAVISDFLIERSEKASKASPKAAKQKESRRRAEMN